MKRRTLLKCVCMILLSSLLLVGCKKNQGLSEKEINTLKTISNELNNTDQVLIGINEIITWQTNGADSDLEKLNNAQKEFTIYDGVSLSTQDANKKYEEFADDLEQITISKDKINNLEKTGNEQIDVTLDATKEYYKRLVCALEDLNNIFVFNREVNAIITDMGKVDISSYNSGAAATAAVFAAVDEGVTKLKEVECPTFMQQVYDKEILGYERLLEVIIEENSAYVYSDYMKMHAASNMYFRVNYEAQQYRIDLLNDYDMQFEKVSERIETRINPIRDEIKDNIESLLLFYDYGAKEGE